MVIFNFLPLPYYGYFCQLILQVIIVFLLRINEWDNEKWLVQGTENALMKKPEYKKTKNENWGM